MIATSPEVLGATLDAQASVLEAMVHASQRQIAAILAYRADLRRAGPDELTLAQGDLARLLGELRTANEAVSAAAQAIQPGATPVEAARRLPLRERLRVEEKLSVARSLAQALSELQRITQFHAQRGLQIVQAWRSLVDPAVAAGTYTRPRGTRRVGRRTDMESHVLEVDL